MATTVGGMASGDSARLRAVAHPLRLHMLSLLTGAELSAAELARELDTTQANASYHLRVLAAVGLVVEAEQVKIRGGVAKRYRYPWRDGASGEAPSPPRDHPDRRLFVEALCAELVRRQGSAGGGPWYDADADMWVPPQVWQQVLELSHRAGTLMHEHAQPPRTPGAVHASFTTVAFTLQGQEESADATA